MKWPLDWEAKDYMKHLIYFNNKLGHGKEIQLAPSSEPSQNQKI